MNCSLLPSTLFRQPHLSQQSLVTRVVPKASEVWIDLQIRQSPVMLFVSALEPIEGLIEILARGIDTGNLVGHETTILLLYQCEGFVRLGAATQTVEHERPACVAENISIGVSGAHGLGGSAARQDLIWLEHRQDFLRRADHVAGKIDFNPGRTRDIGHFDNLTTLQKQIAYRFL